ncbi:proteoglycan 4-like [Venturia canescens]|uniref:proteoglycan 4-like n=1 Tax=Venturia canescens TaxID=32260 RepID=UPI001C9C8411|nr:proteoglycan 4-like [Venturia canescens]
MEISSSSEEDGEDSSLSQPVLDLGSDTEEELLRDTDEQQPPPSRSRPSTAAPRSSSPTSSNQRDRSPRSPRRVPPETRYSPSRDPSPGDPRRNRPPSDMPTPPRHAQPPPPRAPSPMAILEELLEALDQQPPLDVDPNPVFDAVRPYAPLLAAGEFVRPGFLDALVGLTRGLTHRTNGFCPIAEGLRHPRSMGSSATIRDFPPTREAASQTHRPITSEAESQTSSLSTNAAGHQTDPPTTRDTGSQTLPVDNLGEALGRLATSQGADTGLLPSDLTRGQFGESTPQHPGPSSRTPAPERSEPRGTRPRASDQPARPNERIGANEAPPRPVTTAAAAPRTTPRATPNQPTDTGSSARYRRCFNCGSTSHRRQECTQPPRQFCYRCGILDVTVRTCPKHGSEYEKEEPWKWNRR